MEREGTRVDGEGGGGRGLESGRVTGGLLYCCYGKN